MQHKNADDRIGHQQRDVLPLRAQAAENFSHGGANFVGVEQVGFHGRRGDGSWRERFDRKSLQAGPRMRPARCRHVFGGNLAHDERMRRGVQPVRNAPHGGVAIDSLPNSVCSAHEVR